MITVCRTIFYQFFLLFVGLSIGFICNSEWIGKKSIIMERSARNIFYPIRYDEQLEKAVKAWGACKVCSGKGYPKDFDIIDEHVYGNEEWYWCRYAYRDEKGNLKFEEAVTRVRWKSWEYYYEPDSLIDTNEKAKERMKKLDNDSEKRKEERKKAKEREEEILKNESKSKDVT